MNALWNLLVSYAWMVPVISGVVGALKKEFGLHGLATHLVAAATGVAVIAYLELLVPLHPAFGVVGVGLALGFGTTGLVALPGVVTRVLRTETRGIMRS